MKKILLILLSIPCAVFASDSLSENVMGIIANVGSFVNGICFVVGAGFLAGALVQYMQHRKNKLQVPISKPIIYLILGIILVVLPLLGHFSQGGMIVSR